MSVVAVLGAVVAGLLVAQLGLLVTTVYLHRSLSHRALHLSAGVRGVCRVLTWMLTGIQPRQWVAVHRKHHAFTDTERDPHSPIVMGYARVQFTNASLYRRAARDPSTVARYARDLPPDRWDRWLFDRAAVGLGLGIGLLVVLVGWELALIVAVVHATYYLLGGGAINAIGHKWGRRPFDNRATNNQWLAWIVVGEGLHNNHHAAATSSRLSLAKGEIDPGWWCIRILVGLRWATLRHQRAVGRVEDSPHPLDSSHTG
ncbi:MAG TPA: fatty acid desaturase [Acidimicrobiales bacterium]|nr:fatty acid desaturase [Acidimicrobiales bacterium]